MSLLKRDYEWQKFKNFTISHQVLALFSDTENKRGTFKSLQ